MDAHGGSSGDRQIGRPKFTILNRAADAQAKKNPAGESGVQ